MSVALLNNVTVGDDYTEAATARLIGTVEIALQVANAAVLYQLDESANGAGNWGPERFLAKAIGTRAFTCSGIRFRNAVAGAPAQISCELRDANELTGGGFTAFDSFVAPDGSVGSELSLRTGDIFYSASSSARDGTLLCDGTLYDATTDSSLENLWNEIGTTFGGTSKSSFAVPDLRRRFPTVPGPSDSLGDDDGLAVASRDPTGVSITVDAADPTAPGAHAAGAAGTYDGDLPYLFLNAYIVK